MPFGYCALRCSARISELIGYAMHNSIDMERLMSSRSYMARRAQDDASIASVWRCSVRRAQ